MFLYIQGISSLGTDPNPQLSLNVSRTAFIENRGQLTNINGQPVADVLYYTSTPSIDVFVTTRGLTYIFKSMRDSGLPLVPARPEDRLHVGRYQWERVDMDLPGARITKQNADATARGAPALRYYLAHCPEGIETGSYQKIIFRDIYPGIDWVLHAGKASGLKHEFVTSHHSNPRQIRMVYQSLTALTKGNDGSLQIGTALGNLREAAPYSYLLPGNKFVKSAFKIAETKHKGEIFETTVAFQCAASPRLNEKLVLDPDLSWFTLFGGSQTDWVMTITTDAQDNVFTGGSTFSTVIPLLDTGVYFQGISAGPTNAFISKFDSNRNLLWSTFYGGSVSEGIWLIRVDSSGMPYVAGVTNSQDLPLQNGGGWFQPLAGGNTDAFILRFDNAGNRLSCTYFGGSEWEWPTAMELDSKQNLFLSIISDGADLPLQHAGGYFQTKTTGPDTTGYLARFNPAGMLTWGTYFGKSLIHVSLGIDPSDDIYLCGEAWAAGSVPLKNAPGGYFKNSVCGPTDGYITKLDKNTTLVYSSYFGGCETDYCHSLACDKKGNLFVCGTTRSNDFPLKNNGGFFYQGTRSATLPADAFICKVDSAFGLSWSTCIGGSGLEIMYSSLHSVEKRMAVTGCDEVWFEFETTSKMKTKPACEGGYIDSTFHFDNSNSSAYDMFLTRFSNEGHLQYASYFGDSEWSIGHCIYCSPDGKLFLTGGWRPKHPSIQPAVVDPGSGAYVDSTWNGLYDGYIAEFSSKNTVVPQYFYYPPAVCKDLEKKSPEFGPGFAPGGTFSSQPGLNVDSVSGILDLADSSPGVYTVSYSGGSCACSPTVSSSTTVQVLPSLGLELRDTTICEGTKLVLSAKSLETGLTYTWLPSGASTSTIQLTPATTTNLQIRAEKNGCFDSVMVTVQVLERENSNTSFSYPNLVCANSGALSPFLAENFRKGGTFTAAGGVLVDSGTGIVNVNNLKGGSYTVYYHVDEGNCYNAASSQAQLNIKDSFTINLKPYFLMVEGSNVTLTADKGKSFSWEPGDFLSCTDCSRPVASPVETTRYCVTATEGVCTSQACTLLDVICNNTGDFSIPSAFTPNSDGNNDAFCLQGWKKCALDFKVRIFDRWGAVMFESGDPDFCWDGTYNGQLLPAGTYVYAIYARYRKDGEMSKGGNILLMR